MDQVLQDGTVGKALIMLDIVADAGHSMRFNHILAVSYTHLTLPTIYSV